MYSVLNSQCSTLSQTTKFCNFFSSLIVVGEMVGQNCGGCRSWEEDIYWSHFQFLHFVQFLRADYDQHLVSNFFLLQRNGIFGFYFEYMMMSSFFYPLPLFHLFYLSQFAFFFLLLVFFLYFLPFYITVICIHYFSKKVLSFGLAVVHGSFFPRIMTFYRIINVPFFK